MCEVKEVGQILLLGAVTVVKYFPLKLAENLESTRECLVRDHQPVHFPMPAMGTFSAEQCHNVIL